MREYYVALYYDDEKLQQIDFGNPQIFEQGLYELRKKGITFDAFIVQLDAYGKLRLLPWS